jgi:hypothetical protein
MTKIASFQKNKRETLVVELSKYKGHNLVSLRVWVEKSDGSGATPTTKGVTFNVSLLPVIRKAFEDAEAEAKRLNMFSGGEHE